jgi:pyridoxamine 5'-phosphate oxidase
MFVRPQTFHASWTEANAPKSRCVRRSDAYRHARMSDLATMRRAYTAAGLDAADLAPTWLEQFRRWLAEVVAAGLTEPNAMVLATASATGRPSARTVLLKAVDERGFGLYTNLESRKGREAGENPQAALVFPWIELQRQVIVGGAVERVDDAASDAYFASRPHGAKLGAVSSPQSQPIAARSVLDDARTELAARYPEGVAVPRPAHWGGLRVVPDEVEFWQGRPDRLHDRLRYRRAEDGAWKVERLAP